MSGNDPVWLYNIFPNGLKLPTRNDIQILWRLNDIYICHPVPSVLSGVFFKGNPCWWDQQFKKDWFTSFKNTPRNQMEHQHIKQTSIAMKETVETPGHHSLFPGALCLGRLDGMEWLHTSLRWWPTDTSSCYHSRGLRGIQNFVSWTFGYPRVIKSPILGESN